VGRETVRERAKESLKRARDRAKAIKRGRESLKREKAKESPRRARERAKGNRTKTALVPRSVMALLTLLLTITKVSMVGSPLTPRETRS